MALLITTKTPSVSDEHTTIEDKKKKKPANRTRIVRYIVYTAVDVAAGSSVSVLVGAAILINLKKTEKKKNTHNRKKGTNGLDVENHTRT